MSEAPAAVIGVAGAGTMGAGIAQLACMGGARTLLHDPAPAALERGLSALRANLRKGADRGRWSAEQAEAAASRLHRADELEQLAPCELVIEAAPESLELKHSLFSRLSEIVNEACVLATNTSSLPVTAIAAAARKPERVVGMHFFNPAPLMRLLEVVAGDASDERSLGLARATGEAMGKHVIRATDGPGFLVNRCNRPYGLEALRLLAEGIADVSTIDTICRLGGGFRMGPFELMDLVGVDVGMEISKSFYAQSFGEPRWRPSPIAQKMVDAGRHGRKAGRGYYDYRAGEHRAPDPDPEPAAAPADGGVVIVTGASELAEELRACALAAGWSVAAPGGGEHDAVELVVDCRAHAGVFPRAARRAILCEGACLAALDESGEAVGFHALPPLAESRLVELTRGGAATDQTVAAVERFFSSLGKQTAWVGDAPGLVLGRIVCQVINEAAFALGEGVGTVQDIDAGMVLGLNHPRGPLAWADTIGIDRVLEVLGALRLFYGEERYRPAPALTRLLLDGRLGTRAGGGGFHRGEQA